MTTPPFEPLQYVYQLAPVPTPHTLLLLHGTGGDEHDLLPLAPQFGAAVNVLSLRGNVLEGRQPRFFRRLGLGLLDEEDVVFRTHELVLFLWEVAQTEAFDPTQLVAVGYSNGANMVGSILMLYPELLAGAVLWRPMQPLVRLLPTFTTARRQPVLFSPGMHDPTVQPRASQAYVALLRAAGFDVRHQPANAGHHLSPDDVEAAGRWYRQHFSLKNRLSPAFLAH